MRFLRSKRGIAILALLLVALFLVRPGVNRLRTRIVSSIGLALGRQIEVSAVNLRLLPRPGFDLTNFVVYDDPAFSAEPMLRAEEVTASLRVTSLLRGRLEIAQLNLTEPSLNLVRNPDGHWNLESLLERAARTPVAPTSKPKSEKRPGFPYIECDRGRINFKFGPEKKPYALTEADFALWQDSENAWAMRLRAQPVRTDFNLTDTGIVQVNGSWQRAAALRETPLQFNLLWQHAQLGQVTKLAYGNDKGWRGSIDLSAALTGTPANLSIEADASVDDFRRYDILGGGDLRLSVRCSSHYSLPDRALSQIACNSPTGNGSMTVDGSIAYPAGQASYDLWLTAHDLPIQSLAAFARHAKQGIPDDLRATGNLSAKIRLRRGADSNASPAVWEGKGETSDFHLASALMNAELALETVPFAIAPAVDPKALSKRHPQTVKAILLPPSETHLDIGPFHVALGKPAPAMVQGWVSRTGYAFAMQGDAQVQRLLQSARMLGISAPQPAAEGWAKVDLQIASGWSGFAPPKAVGQAQLHAIRAEVRGLNAPLEIFAANLTLAPDKINVQNLAASAAGASWHGSLVVPRLCAEPGTCPVRFDLHADEITTDQLNRLLNPHVRKQPWYRFLSSTSSATPYLMTSNSMGKLTADRAVIRNLVASRVSAEVELSNGQLRLSALRGDMLGGRHTGEWQADFSTSPPRYSGTGTLEQVALGQLAQAMKDAWIAGSAQATYRVNTSGLSAADLFAAASGTVQVEARDGVLPHIVLGEGSGPLQIRRLRARLLLHDGQFEIHEGKLETPAGIYQISGTATLARILDLRLTRGGEPGFNITGSLTEPRVSAIVSPETQAALKP